MSEGKSYVLRPLELYRTLVDAIPYNLSEGIVSGAQSSALKALLYLLNFANSWYTAQIPGNDDSYNLRVKDDKLSMIIHLLISRRICDLTGQVAALNVQRRLATRDSILTKVLANRKISDTSAALLYRLENVTASFGSTGGTGDESVQQRPEGFPDGMPDSLSFIEVSKSAGYTELVGVDEAIDKMETRIKAGRTAKVSTVILLYGPPGTGKTSLVVAAARQNNLPVATVTSSNLGGEFIGEREKNISDLFDYMEKVTQDFILFIDEADSFIPEQYENNTQSRLIRVLTINRILRLINRNDGVMRLVVLASNYDDRIARDVAESSFKVYLGAPSTIGQMKDLFTFYRKRTNMNMTRIQLNYAAEVALQLKYAPGHVSLLMQRMLTSNIIKLLNNRVKLVTTSVDGVENNFERPIYMIEQSKVFEDNSQSVTLALVTDEPLSASDDDRAVSWERGNEIAFPIADLTGIDFQSVLGTRTDVALPNAPISPMSGLVTEQNTAVLAHVQEKTVPEEMTTVVDWNASSELFPDQNTGVHAAIHETTVPEEMKSEVDWSAITSSGLVSDQNSEAYTQEGMTTTDVNWIANLDGVVVNENYKDLDSWLYTDDKKDDYEIPSIQEDFEKIINGEPISSHVIEDGTFDVPMLTNPTQMETYVSGHNNDLTSILLQNDTSQNLVN